MLSIALTILIIMACGWGLLAVFGAAARFVPRPMKPIELHAMGRASARAFVTDVLWSAMDSRFGFPTGFFAVDRALSDQDTVVAVEQELKGSDVQATVMAIVTGPIDWGRRERSEAIGVIAGVAVGIVAAPIAVWVAVGEQIMRRLLRSRIVARLEDLPNEHGTVVKLTLYGPSAWVAARQIKSAFGQPRLPVRVTRKAGKRSRQKEKQNV